MKLAVPRSTPFLLLAVASCGTPAQVGGNAAHRQPASRIRPPEPKISANPAPVRSGTGKVTRIPLGDLFNLHQENRVLIFDVRPAFVYKLGHVPGAVNWPKASFNSQLAIHEPQIAAAKAEGKPVVLYCVDFACPDARAVATWLAERGHSISVLEGGWDAWKTGGLPSE
jgi:rhodanese-related sulfurtransferase